jgi:serine/threonine protein kinase/WD40 repeat protein
MAPAGKEQAGAAAGFADSTPLAAESQRVYAGVLRILPETSMPSTNPTVSERQLRRARAELEDGLRRGNNLRAEDLLAAYPTLAGDNEAALELVYLEFAVREGLGQAPTPAQWYERFPQWRADLEQMFQVHDELRLAVSDLGTQDGESSLGRPMGTGDRIAGYVVVEELGRGGMGVVYQARQVRLNRTVALKLILAGEYASPKQRERFQREAEAAARLDHPNIVRVLEVGEHAGRPFCSMEYVDGGSLADRLTGAPWPARTAAELVAAIARAAHHAHERGVVHRDLKPANILIAGDPRSPAERSTDPEHPPKSREPQRLAGTPKIADFGLAKSLNEERGGGPTRTGDVLGTPAYMAPEQTGGRAQPVGPATDVWALGAILYELLTGRPPFQGDSTVETLQQVRQDDPVSPRRLRPRLPRDLETICLKCLRKAPHDRYGSAAELADDLERWLRQEPIVARPVGPWGRMWRWCRRNPRVAALSAGLVVLTCAAANLGAMAVVNLAEARVQAGKRADQERRGRLREAESRALDRRRLVRMYLADATRRLDQGDTSGAALYGLAALRSDPDPDSEAVHRIRLGTMLRACPQLRLSFMTPKAKPGFALASEDGSTFFTSDGVADSRVWDTATGRSRPVRIPAEDWSRGALNDTGQVLAVIRRDGRAQAWDLKSGDTPLPVALPLTPPQGALTRPFSRNGSRWTRTEATLQGLRLSVHSADGSSWTVEPKPSLQPRYHDLSPDGRFLAVVYTDGSARLFHAATGEWASPSMRPGGPIAQVSAIVFHPDGQWLAYGWSDGMAQVWDTASHKPAGHRVAHGGVVTDLVFSADGGRLLTQGGDRAYRAWNVPGGYPIGPPVRQEVASTARFSPEGSAIVVVGSDDTARVWDDRTGQALSPPLTRAGGLARFRGDRRHLVTLGLRGEARSWEIPEPVSVRHKGPVWKVAWLDDGRTVLSISHEAILWDPITGAVRQSLEHPGLACNGALAFDQRRALLLGFDSEIRQLDTRSGEWVGARLRVPAGRKPAVYTPDGRIVTTSHDTTIHFWNADNGRPEGAALSQPLGVEWGIDFRPDGRRMLARGLRSCLWDLPAGRPVRTFSSESQARPDAIVLSPDGQFVAVIDTSGMLRRYETESGSPLAGPVEVGEWADKLTLSPEGRRVAAVRPEDHSVRTWDLGTGRPVGPALPHAREIFQIAFSPDGRLLATSSLGDAARVWDLASGVPVAPPLALPGGANELAFSPRGDRLAVGSPLGLVCSLDLTPNARTLDELEARAQILAGRRLDDRGDLVPLPRAEEDALWRRIPER